MVDVAVPDGRLATVLAWWGRLAVGAVFAMAVVDWVGWATGLERLTRFFPSWPQMTPWTAVLAAGLGVAILLQSGQLSSVRIRLGVGAAVVVGVLAVVFLAEYLTHRSFGLDGVWFHDEVRRLQATLPGRPSPQTSVSVLLVSAAGTVMRTESRHRWVSRVWLVALVLAAIIPFVVIAAYGLQAIALVGIAPSTGMGISTALSVLLLVLAAFLARPDRRPVSWLAARPDGWTLVRLVGIFAGLPLLLGMSRLVFLSIGFGADPALALAVTVSTIVVGLATFYLSQREQKLLIERAEAEARYRLLADNAVDIVEHLRGRQITWISPSVESALGRPPEQWVGNDFADYVHPEDRAMVLRAQELIGAGQSSVERFRIRAADGGYRWVDCLCKPYLTANGDRDGVIAAMRIADDQVEAQRRLERLAHFDTLTGLANRTETIARLERALRQTARTPGSHLGVLFCDIDHFKSINDTFGHAAGDIVLSTVAARVRECVREHDTVGRIGGDEILVLLPGLHNLDEAAEVAEKIRLHAGQPICNGANTIRPAMSIGVTLNQPGESASDLMARADVAMYQAKEAGRNNVTRI